MYFLSPNCKRKVKHEMFFICSFYNYFLAYLENKEILRIKEILASVNL